MKKVLSNDSSYAQTARDMTRYLRELKKERKTNPKEAKRKAYESLYASGIITKKGKTKKKIVNR